MTDSITFDRRFHGPPDSAHGGYACGRLAAFVEGPAELYGASALFSESGTLHAYAKATWVLLP